MSDKELLELAAKAAGIEICFAPWPMRYVDAQDQKKAFTVKWNPLDDDGDALRLAVKLRMLVDVPNRSGLMIEVIAPGLRKSVFEPMSSDLTASTRRAIVRAAADKELQ